MMESFTHLNPMTIDPHKKNKNLKISYLTAIGSCMMVGLTQDYFAPFLLLIGATAFHIGIFNSLNNLFSSLAQLPSAYLSLKFCSRKKVILFFVFLQILMLALLCIYASFTSMKPALAILLIICVSAFGAITHPGWVSMLSDMVDPEIRGSYFGWRARNLGFITILVTFLAGFILYFFNKLHPLTGFIFIFTAALLSRIASFFYIKQMAEPPLRHRKEDAFSLWEFLVRIKESNFVRFVLFTAGTNFSVNIAAPFFSIFMLEDLSFNYIQYMLINIVAPLTLYALIGRWGKHADQIGNLKILKFVAPLFGFIPLLWIISQNMFFLIFAEAISGFLWAGFNLCASNFIIDAVIPEKRTRCIAYFSLINGAALALGAFLGGLMLEILPPLYGHKILTLFLISSVCRIFCGLLLSRKIKEVRPVERVTSKELLFSMIGVKPIAGIERKSVQV